MTLEKKRFQSPGEAEKALSKGEEVIYIGHSGREVVGIFRGGAGGCFSFVGKNEWGVIVPVNHVPYWQFAPKV